MKGFRILQLLTNSIEDIVQNHCKVGLCTPVAAKSFYLKANTYFLFSVSFAVLLSRYICSRFFAFISAYRNILLHSVEDKKVGNRLN